MRTAISADEVDQEIAHVRRHFPTGRKFLRNQIRSRESGLAEVTVFGKGDKTRHVLISKRLYKELTRLRGHASDDAPVFPSKTGKPLDQPAVFRVIQAAAQRAGIEQAVSPNWFRHAAASHALDNGCPISLVKEQLGHSSLEVTSVYVHARPTDGLFKYLCGWWP